MIIFYRERAVHCYGTVADHAVGRGVTTGMMMMLILSR